MKTWRVILNGVDITQKVDLVETRFEAENVSGEIEVSIADRAVLDGIVLPRVPQGLSIVADALVAGVWVSRGSFFLEETTQPPDLRARTATIWGRTLSARLTKPFAPKISRQWPAATTIAAILEELGTMCGVTIQIQNDFPICAYCYAVSDWYPSQIIQDLAEKSGQICWPQVDGSLLIAPRLYRNLPNPDVTLIANQIEVQSVKRQVPDFGNRILVSGDGAVAGLSVQVVPMYLDNACVAANGEDVVRLIAVVLDVDGGFVALGTTVGWTVTGGSLLSASSATAIAEIIGEEQRATDYFHVTIDLPASAVIGVYAYSDIRRKNNLFQSRRGSVAGRVITFASPLDYFDQAVIVDYEVQGATNEWTSGRIPGDVIVLASVAGAQGQTTLHQSNPTACASTLTLECVPSSVCLGSAGVITAKAVMFGGAGSGEIRFALSGCGRLSSTRKTLTAHDVTETLRISNWGGVSQVRLSAVPASGAINVYLESAPTINLYASDKGQTVNLDTQMLSGTQVVVEYPGGGTALVSWIPDGSVTGDVLVREAVQTTDDGTNSFVELSHAPTSGRVDPVAKITESASYVFGVDLYGSHSGTTLTLNARLTAGTTVYCTYWADQPLQPDCNATILARIDDGSQDGGIATISVTARDCRTLTSDPTLPPDETSPDDPTAWPDIDDDDDPEDIEEPSGTGCGAVSIQGRTPAITVDNWDAVSGVAGGADCPGLCTCDQICAALRSNGSLAKAGEFYSTCMAKCAAAREAKCTPCTLTGPSTLNPGETGVWTDGKGNSGEASGALAKVSRDFETGYTMRMPTGGQGPFTIQVCYGEEDSDCCETTVDFPPCTLSGPSQLEPSAEGSFFVSLGMAGASVVVGGGMEFVRNLPYDVGFIARMKDGECNGGSVTVSYGGRVCGSLTVDSTLKSFVGYVAGPSYMAAGEMAYFTHNLGQEAAYTGTLVLGAGGVGDDGAVLVMPSSASDGSMYSASWESPICGRKASIQVRAAIGECDGGTIVSVNGVSYCIGPLDHIDHSCFQRYTGSTPPCTYYDSPQAGTPYEYVSGPWYYKHVFVGEFPSGSGCEHYCDYDCYYYPIIGVIV